MAALVGLFAGILAPSLAVGVVALLLLPLAQWKWPYTGAVVLLAGAVLIEQFPLPRSDTTDKIPLFRSLQSFGLTGVTVNVLELLLVAVLIVWLLRRGRDKSPAPAIPRSSLAAALALLLVAVIIGLVIGLTNGGDLRSALWEIRPWVYLVVTYVLASSVLETRSAWRAVMWTLVIGSGIKALQGTILFLGVVHMKHRPQALLGHEESFFFGLYIALLLGMWLFGLKGRLRVTATALAPFVLLAEVTNDRRAAWAVVFAEVILMLILTYARLPERRRLVRRLSGSMLLVGAVYVPAFWNDVGALGQPARAVRTVIAPDARDKASDQYRKVENFNLILNIRTSKPFARGIPLGEGFGIKIVDGSPIVNLTNIDSFIAYVPHNGFLYVWLRMGLLGELALWSVVAAGILKACTCLKSEDRETAFLGLFVVCALVAWLVIGYYDMGLFWFRIAVAMGCFLGLVEAHTRVASSRRRPVGEKESEPVAGSLQGSSNGSHRETVGAGSAI